MDCSLPPVSFVHGLFQTRILQLGCHFPLQGSFLTQGSNPRFLNILHYPAELFFLLTTSTTWEAQFVYLLLYLIESSIYPKHKVIGGPFNTVHGANKAIAAHCHRRWALALLASSLIFQNSTEQIRLFMKLGWDFSSSLVRSPARVYSHEPGDLSPFSCSFWRKNKSLTYAALWF